VDSLSVRTFDPPLTREEPMHRGQVDLLTVRKSNGSNLERGVEQRCCESYQANPVKGILLLTGKQVLVTK
jgi:hypothetical protein